MLRTALVALALLLPTPSLALVIDLPQNPYYDTYAGYVSTASTRVLDFYGLAPDLEATALRIDQALCWRGFCVMDDVAPEIAQIGTEQGKTMDVQAISYWDSRFTQAAFAAEVAAGRPSIVLLDLDPGPSVEIYSGVLAGYENGRFGVDYGLGMLWYPWVTMWDNYGLSDIITVKVTHPAEAAPVPEPSTLLLAAIGTGVCLLHRRKSWSCR